MLSVPGQDSRGRGSQAPHRHALINPTHSSQEAGLVLSCCPPDTQVRTSQTGHRVPPAPREPKRATLHTWDSSQRRGHLGGQSPGTQNSPTQGTATLGSPGSPAWPRVLPLQTAKGSQPRTCWEAHGRPGQRWGHSVGTKPVCKHWRPQPCSGSHEGKKQKMEQTRRESVYFAKACADRRGAPGPPRPAVAPKGRGRSPPVGAESDGCRRWSRRRCQPPRPSPSPGRGGTGRRSSLSPCPASQAPPCCSRSRARF